MLAAVPYSLQCSFSHLRLLWGLEGRECPVCHPQVPESLSLCLPQWKPTIRPGVEATCTFSRLVWELGGRARRRRRAVLRAAWRQGLGTWAVCGWRGSLPSTASFVLSQASRLIRCIPQQGSIPRDPVPPHRAVPHQMQMLSWPHSSGLRELQAKLGSTASPVSWEVMGNPCQMPGDGGGTAREMLEHS